MTVLMQATFGGEVRQTGPRRLESEYPHRFITVLMAFPVLIFSAGSVFSIIGAITTRQPAILISAAMGGIAAAFMGWRMHHRIRSMGSFLLDLDRNELIRRRGKKDLDRYALGDVVGIHRLWDPFHRSFVQHYWLVLDMRDGRRFRMGKGPKHEVDHCLGLMRSWGLPAA